MYKPKKDLLAIDRKRQTFERGKTDISKMARKIITRPTGDNIYKLVLFWIRYAEYNCTELVPLTGYEIRANRTAIDNMFESYLKNFIIKCGTKTNCKYTIDPKFRHLSHDDLYNMFRATHLPETYFPSVKIGDMNGWETTVLNILIEEYGSDWKFTGAGDLRKSVGRFYPDLICECLKGIIEVNGPKHEYDITKNTRREEEKRKRIVYADRGYQTLFIWKEFFIPKNAKKLRKKIISWVDHLYQKRTDETQHEEVING